MEAAAPLSCEIISAVGSGSPSTLASFLKDFGLPRSGLHDAKEKQANIQEAVKEVQLYGNACGCVDSGDVPRMKMQRESEVVPERDNQASRAETGFSRCSKVIDCLQTSLMTNSPFVVRAMATEGPRGWTVTAYVLPERLRFHRSEMVVFAQQALINALETIGRLHNIVLLGHAEMPFSPMAFGFGAAVTEMLDEDKACHETYMRGFCPSPSTCTREHPLCLVGINVMLKPARNPAGWRST